MRTFPTSEAEPGTLAAARALMDDAFGDRFSDEDWEHALGGWHGVVEVEGAVVSHAAVVERTLEVDGRPYRTGYVEAMATAPAQQGAGLGSLLMVEAAAVIRAGFDLGALATGRHAFYERLGWERWRGPTYVRTASGLVRTEAEDDSILVLRHGATAGLDLSRRHLLRRPVRRRLVAPSPSGQVVRPRLLVRGRRRQGDESEVLEDRSARRRGIDLQVAEPLGGRQRRAVRHQRPEDAAAAPLGHGPAAPEAGEVGPSGELEPTTGDRSISGHGHHGADRAGVVAHLPFQRGRPGAGSPRRRPRRLPA